MNHKDLSELLEYEFDQHDLCEVQDIQAPFYYGVSRKTVESIAQCIINKFKGETVND